jgi:GSCFA family
MNNPYKNLQDYQFWRRGVSNIEAHAIDPVVNPKFSIGRDEKVATAGSCFAQHISRQIKNIGFNYYVPESGDHLDQSEQSRLGYGVFSARFGNIYTVRQLLQLFEEAFGRRGKSEIVWQRDDGRFVDAFRPSVEPVGYDVVEEVLAARATHLQFVKQLFLQSDIFVFTLGLTESWSNRSGEVFPLAPGVAGGRYDENNYSFKNLAVTDVIADLRSFLNGFKEANPKVRVLLTVSPVPLIATYEKKHVLVATTYSKSVLRVAAETATSEFDWVDYFPSYEIITGNFSGGRYYEDDLREIGGMGVNHAMRCFLDNYVAGSDKVLNPRNSVVTGDSEGNGQTAVPRLGDLVCDEELIERVSR